MTELEICILIRRLENGRYSIVECPFPERVEGCQGIQTSARTALKILKNLRFLIDDEIRRILEEEREGGRWI